MQNFQNPGLVMSDRRLVSMDSMPLSPKDYLYILQRRKWSILLPFLIILASSITMALLLPSKYRSMATILIEEQEIPQDFVTATVTSFAEQRLQQINQRIMSTTKLLEIIDSFNLYRKMRAQRTTEEVIAQMREDVRMEPISTEVMDRRTGRATVATIAFSLSYEGKDTPDTIQRVANRLVSLFLQENLEVRERQTQETSQFLEVEMQRVRKELSEIEQTLSDFKEKNMSELPELLQVNIQGLNNSERDIERLEEQLRTIKEREGYLESQLANLSPFLERPDRTRLAMLETELVVLENRFTEDHPDVVKTRGEILSLKKAMANNQGFKESNPKEPDNPAYVTLSAQLSSTKAELLSIQNHIQETKKNKAKYEAKIEKTPRVERQYRELTGRQMNIEAKHNDLMQKHMEARVAQGLEKGQKGERFTLIDPPRLPEKPFKPNRLAIMLIWVVLGIGAGVGWASFREFSDQAVNHQDRLSLITGYPVLGIIPGILTLADKKRIRAKRMASVSIALAIFLGGLLTFHFFIMDLNVFWAKLGRKFLIP